MCPSLENADFTHLPEARKAFDLLGTTDFEVVIHALRQSIALLPLYSVDSEARSRMEKHSETLKELLVQAIAGRHPERPSDVNEAQYHACRIFLAHFAGETRNLKPNRGKDLRANIYTLNYDLLLYWTLLHDQVIDWNATDPLPAVASLLSGRRYIGIELEDRYCLHARNRLAGAAKYAARKAA